MESDFLIRISAQYATSAEAVRNLEEMAAKLNSYEKGSGVNIRVSGLTAKELAEELSDWPGGVGLYPEPSAALHLDNRPNRARWGGL